MVTGWGRGHRGHTMQGSWGEKHGAESNDLNSKRGLDGSG